MTRSIKNWNVKHGGWDSLNISELDFGIDYPCLSSITKPVSYDLGTLIQI